MELQPPEAPHCAQHPLQPAMATCARCGSFMCAQCVLPGSDLCPACRARAGARPWPLARDRWTFGEVWELAFAAFKVNWVNLTVAVLITFGISGAVGGLGSGIQVALSAARAPAVLTLAATFTVQVGSSIVQGMLGLGLTHMCLEMFAGRPVELPMVFSGFSQLGRWLGAVGLALLFLLPALVVIGLVVVVAVNAHGEPSAGLVAVVVVGSVALLIYGFWVGLPLGFLGLELMLDRTTGPMQVVRNCFAVASDCRLEIFGVVLVEVLVTMAGVLACCVGLLPASALVAAIHAALFLSLRNGAAVEKA